MAPRKTSSSSASNACARVRPLLEPYHDDALAPAQEAFVVRHLAACEACAAELAGLAALRTMLRKPVSAELLDQPADHMWTRVAADLDRQATRKMRGTDLAAQRTQRVWRLWARPALAMGTAAVLLTVALVAPPKKPQDVNVAKDTFMIEHIDAGEGGVLVYESEDTDMTIIWMIDAEEELTPQDQVAL